MDPQGNRGGFRGRGRGGMGRGRGPIIFHNFQQQGHYARDCPQPTTTCMYCRAVDHMTEECPKLMMKIQEKRNLNNQNVQWIVAEIRDPGRNINIVTRGGVKTGEDAHDQKKESQCWIQKNTQPQQQFDAKKEKETFKEAKKEFLKENVASTSNTRLRYDTPIFYIDPGGYRWPPTFSNWPKTCF
jgi:hypothetical protein